MAVISVWVIEIRIVKIRVVSIRIVTIRVIPWIITPSPAGIVVVSREIRVRVIRGPPEIISHINACSVIIGITSVPIGICIEIIVISIRWNTVMEAL
mgnify:CR=1 FL=1